jgi:hypothetical protein
MSATASGRRRGEITAPRRTARPARGPAAGRDIRLHAVPSRSRQGTLSGRRRCAAPGPCNGTSGWTVRWPGDCSWRRRRRPGPAPSTDRRSRKVRLGAADIRTRSCCYAAYGLRTRRRRSRDRPSLVSPPQMPCLIEFASAYSRHWAHTGHRVHTAAAFASRISRSCGLSPSRPKNSSASWPTQAALSCQLTPQHSRPATSAHLGPLRREPPPSPFCAARNLSIQAAAYAAPGAKVPPARAPRRQSLRPGRTPRWPVAPARAR